MRLTNQVAVTTGCPQGIHNLDTISGSDSWGIDIVSF